MALAACAAGGVSKRYCGMSVSHQDNSHPYPETYFVAGSEGIELVGFKYRIYIPLALRN
jgi:hypothetical protein